jgi:hypothetical protein
MDIVFSFWLLTIFDLDGLPKVEKKFMMMPWQ